MDQPKELRKQRSTVKLRKKRFSILKWFRGSRRQSVQQLDPPTNPPPATESRTGWMSRMGLPMRAKNETCSSRSSDQDSEGPITPKTSPSGFSAKALSFEEQREINQKRKSTIFSLARRPFSSHTADRRTPFPISMSMDCDRYISKDAALRQLRDIRSFDDMIANGFNAPCPEEPRSYTIAFTLTPPLRSESE